MNIFKMAWRNIWRNQRRTAVTVAAMSLALFMMINYSGLVKGYIIDMEQKIIDYEMGDIQIVANEYHYKPSLYTRVETPEVILAGLNQAGLDASARLLASGLAAGKESSAGISLRGIDLERDIRVSRIHTAIYKGAWLDAKDPKGVVLGQRLARILNMAVNDEIVILSQAADGSLANDLFYVKGILKIVSGAIDHSGVFMTSRSFRNLMAVPVGAHQIIVRKPVEMPLSTAFDIAKKCAPSLDVKTWRQLMPVLASMLDSVQIVVYSMFLIVYITIGIVIFNAMLMAVFERIREFGVLKALGFGPYRVLSLILVESSIQTGLAMVVGGVCSIPTIYFLSTSGLDLGGMGGITIVGIAFDSVMRASVGIRVYAGPMVTLMLIVFLAVLYPAIKAALIRPAAAIVYR